MKIIATVLAICAATSVQAAERRYTVRDFDAIQIDGPYQVILSTARSPSAVATGSAEALDRVSVTVEGRTLRVRPNPSAWGGYPGADKGSVKIHASTHQLRTAFVNGSGGLSVDKAKGMRLDFELSGSGQLSLASVETDNLVVGLLGSGKITLAGKAKQLRATIQGTGELDAAGLSVEDANLIADTSGKVGVAAVRTAKVTSTGAGDVTVSGKPACTVEGLGAGQVRCGR